MSTTAPQLLEKSSFDREYYTMDFSNWLSSSETISGILEITSEKRGGGISELSIQESGIDTQTVYMWISSGVDYNTYRIEVSIQTSTGRRLNGDGLLKVTDK